MLPHAAFEMSGPTEAGCVWPPQSNMVPLAWGSCSWGSPWQQFCTALLFHNDLSSQGWQRERSLAYRRFRHGHGFFGYKLLSQSLTRVRQVTQPTLAESLHTYTHTRRETLALHFLSARLSFIFLMHLELFLLAPDFFLNHVWAYKVQISWKPWCPKF